MNSTARFTLPFLAVGAYIAVFFLSYPVLGPGVIGFSIVVPLALGWTTGLRGGIISGLAMFPVNVALLLMQGMAGMHVMTHGGLIGTIMLVVIGGVIGHLHDVQGRLRESEHKFRKLAETTSTAIMLYQDDRWVYANPAAEHICGYSSDKLREMAIQDIVAPEYRDIIQQRAAQRQQGKQAPSGYEFKIITKQGQEKWVYLEGTTMDYQGRPAGLISAVDITDRKRTEEQLRLAQYSLDNAAFSIFWITPEGRFRYVNDAACTNLGYSREELLDMYIWDVDPDHTERERAERWRAYKREKLQTFETRHQARDGRIYPVEVTACYIRHEGREYEFAYAVDISGRKKAERRYRSVVEHAHDAIYIIHPEKGFQYVNPAFEELTGYTAEEVYSEAFTFWDIIHPDDVARIEQRGEARERGETVPDRYEFRIIARDGTTKILEAATVDIGTGDDALVMGILRDVTEQERAIREMERALHLEKQFKADVAHFFLNPIAIAKGYMELAMEHMPEDCRNKIAASRDAIKRIETVIKNIVEKGEIHE